MVTPDSGIFFAFAKLAVDLEAIAKVAARARSIGVAGFCAKLLFVLTHAQRFYVPESADVISNRPFTREFRALIRLPADAMVVYSHSHINAPNRQNVPCELMSFAWRLGGEVDRVAVLTGGEWQGTNGFGLASAVRAPGVGGGGWNPCPVIGVAELPEHQDGYILHPYLHDSLATGLAWSGNVASELFDDFASVCNCCVLLNVERVSASLQTPPLALAKSRAKKGKPPLFDYHILVVDGERWDRPAARFGSGTDRGVRSHFRRGHLRRVSADRVVWVRETVVHGSVEGWVEKDYLLGTKGLTDV